MRSIILDVSPDMAKEMLTHSPKNRLLKKRHITRMANDMKDGNFTFSPSPICFDVNGNLIDGHHRLHAVILADKTIKFLVVYDVQPDAVIDRGITRNVGDALYMRNIISKEMSTRQSIAVANRYLEILNGHNPSDTEMASFLNENEDYIATAIHVSACGTHHAICKRAPIQAAILGALLNGVNEDTLLAFTNIVNTGFSNDVSQSAAIVLRNHIITAKYWNSGATPSNELCALTEMAIRDYVLSVPRKRKYTTLQHIYIGGGKVVPTK